MSKSWFYLLLLFWQSSLDAQKLQKYPIGNSGCQAYNFCDPGEFELNRSEDSSAVWTAACTVDSVTYGIICVKLYDETSDLSAAEALLISYLDFLKLSFDVTRAAGYGKGHRLQGLENTRGVIDYWEDKDKNQIKIKGWADTRFIAVLYAYSRKDAIDSKTDIFLNGFRFPEMK
ncbi:MAG: hypothetical protein GC171_02870 [Terrimonas sp.]|nr:hypothetical protein [Terrimonas sp.]